MTPASYWLVNADNYFEDNIAAGSTHYGVWFFPERKIVGASGREKGAEGICPPHVPVLRFADIEVHNNGRFGLRISSEQTGLISSGTADFFAPKR